MTDSKKSMTIAIAWCLAWGKGRQPQFPLPLLQEMREALLNETEIPGEVAGIVAEVRRLEAIPEDYFPETIAQLQDKYPDLWHQDTKIGLVYGGATKIKQYVFESAKIQDVRGASALLDQINLIDLPAFFGLEPTVCDIYPDARQEARNWCQQVRQWLDKCLLENESEPKLSEVLIPELIIYSTGGNILAFCPAAFVDDLANAIEKRYTERTLTANSCAVGEKFRLLELRFGLLNDDNKLWLDWYLRQDVHTNPIVESYFGSSRDKQTKKKKNVEQLTQAFQERKNFNELAGKLAGLFQQRRNGNDGLGVNRSSRCYPPMYETHPYLIRDENEYRCAVIREDKLPGKPYLSESLRCKRIMGDKAKKEQESQWCRDTELDLDWEPGFVESWVSKFKQFLQDSGLWQDYYLGIPENRVIEAKRLEEIGKASRSEQIFPKKKLLKYSITSSNGFVGYISADVNNMGGYIQKQIKTPQEYQEFSQDVLQVMESSVYTALAKHLNPRKLENLTEPESINRNGRIVHPFEILAIGGDDVLLIVPADKALEIAQTIGSEFEKQLAEVRNGVYALPKTHDDKSVHRYQGENIKPSRCKLSMSVGVLITDYKTPIYYAERLYEQLLKSAKKQAKDLKDSYNYYGGTVDILTMKSVTMISSKVKEFREEGLTKKIRGSELRRYAAPYTLYELSGLIEAVKALKVSDFPRSQLYQIRSLLVQGKRTTILNYRYFRTRLKEREQRNILQKYFEEPWCQAKTNEGNIAPWMFREKVYETIWQDLVDLYPFSDETDMASTNKKSVTTEANS
ncbi:MAG TPA: type III-B CRISPR-associated protein Cas10/Cmr2 [Cyanobacteria bacterium UBA11149]|nr:type III-B CRISPR-associated protein Cas10/Cmr2 [Cyanobacteria bacterium UBA11367]HBE60808.1 type III-B CRISPR-associated protein Cas10/Cmr2 [Cyanobacteria bacterium UBA11366]HBK66405.1 type III-B CRISPR-associated protein Cas10/Cmr2 [Cyanobacteria bacterium UBA11166]HBR73662.1 type III-B CRISPR-associated protein Cas10/Cmr2 [Cyanobacteria bacterium UBA11159]HBS72213.1 type III-B CRISPR-associated protein Cas10/Cmr2 [Cyanobacteria bacterium UBA11153]HBW90285.1 type III-B CRISPR-associated p